MSIKSFGVSVTVGGTAIGGLKEVTPGGADVSFIETTTHDGDGWRTFVGGLKNGGTLELSGDYSITDSGQDALRTSYGNEAAVVITFTDDSTASFQAICGAYNVTNPLDDVVGFTASLKITGAVTYEAD